MLYLLALLVLTLLPNPVHAQSSEAPTFSVGDEWTLSTGLVRKVMKIDGDNVVISGREPCPTCLIYYDKNLAIVKVTQADGAAPDVSGGFVPVGSEWKLFEFPLEVGKKWTFRATGLVRNAINRYDFVNTVQSYQDVTTRAGTFKAFKILREVTMMPASPTWGNRPITWSTTEWWAPEAKTTVKWTSTSPNAKEWELTSYTVK